jgi:hypothetical protein
MSGSRASMHQDDVRVMIDSMALTHDVGTWKTCRTLAVQINE